MLHTPQYTLHIRRTRTHLCSCIVQPARIEPFSMRRNHARHRRLYLCCSEGERPAATAAGAAGAKCELQQNFDKFVLWGSQMRWGIMGRVSDRCTPGTRTRAHRRIQTRITLC